MRQSKQKSMMKTTSHSRVSLVDHMGSDLSVVNAARVSFDKISEKFSDKDEKLIQYLAKHNHWSPFAHCFVSFRIAAPIFVARQLVKHQVGLSWNEVSRRYVDSEPEFYLPKEWRGKPENAKQGSSGKVELKVPVEDMITYHTEQAKNLYEDLLEDGVAPEQARMVLPQNTMTEWIWSGSLYAFARVYNLRLDSHAQLETQEVAKEIYSCLKALYPVSTEALIESVN